MRYDDPKEILECAKIVLMVESAALLRMASRIPPEFADAINLIYKCKGHVITTGMGKPGYIARKVAATLSSTGTKAFYLHPAEASHGDLGVISKDDVLLAFSLSGETSELFPLLDYAKRFGIPVIGITSAPESTLAKASTILITMEKWKEAHPDVPAPTCTTTVMLGLGDAIAVCLIEKRMFSKEDFKTYHPGGALGRQLLKVKDLMHHEPPLVKQNDKMSEVLITMTAKSFGCAGVVDDAGKLIGIITDGDLRRHISDDILNKKASEVMTPSPITSLGTVFASEVTKQMNERKITSVFVVDENNMPVGILHIHDCLRAGLA